MDTDFIQIIGKFKQNKNAGHDDIGNPIVKKGTNEIVFLSPSSLTNQQGLYSKISKLPKYRPVSIIPCYQLYLNAWYSIGAFNLFFVSPAGWTSFWLVQLV